jgi:predicted flap endonuclease-1-like 5' DNA nuclease
VVRFADLAKLTTADVARLSETLGLLGRIEQENWIEQAQILSSGGDTYYSRRRQRGEIPAAAPVWAQEAPAPTAVAAAPSTVAPVPTPAPPSTPTMQAESAAAAAAAAAGSVAMGITSDAATADGMRGRSDLSGLRSVRAEALRSDITASEMLRSIGAPRPITQIDDLKRVRGIGVLIEKKLNSVGITTYEQIANWTRADIDRVSQLLDFKGRIERENWVEQARILASGGSTDFSRRVDRGEA